MPRVLTVICSVLLLALQYRLWVADGGVAHAYRLRGEVAARTAEIAQLKVRNASLDAEIADLKSGVAAVESRARMLLGMVRPNETFFLIADPG